MTKPLSHILITPKGDFIVEGERLGFTGDHTYYYVTGILNDATVFLGSIKPDIMQAIKKEHGEVLLVPAYVTRTVLLGERP